MPYHTTQHTHTAYIAAYLLPCLRAYLILPDNPASLCINMRMSYRLTSRMQNVNWARRYIDCRDTSLESMSSMLHKSATTLRESEAVPLILSSEATVDMPPCQCVTRKDSTSMSKIAGTRSYVFVHAEVLPGIK